MPSELNPGLSRPTNAYFQRLNQFGHLCSGSKITSRKRGNLDRSFCPRDNWTKMVISFKAGQLLRFAAALAAISIYAYAFSAAAQVAPDIASTSPSASATSTLTLRAPVMPGGTPPPASNLPAVGRFEQEVTSLENRRIEFSQSPIVFYGSSSIRRWKTLSQDFAGYPVVNCGFGGARLSDCVRYVPRLVLRLSLRRWWSTQAITTWRKAPGQTRRLPRSGNFTLRYAAIRSRCQSPISPSNRARLGFATSTTSFASIKW
jgi:hypothetical protein